jgi:hypothetical protein
MPWTVVYHDANARMSAIPANSTEEATEVVARLIRDGRSVAVIRNGARGPEVQALTGAIKEGEP